MAVKQWVREVMSKAPKIGSAKDWEKLAKEDPMWAVASHAGKRRGNTGAWTTDAFLKSGEQEAEAIGEILGLGSFKGKVILEVGCGAGRLARAFANKGARVVGVDISHEMLVLARRHTVCFSTNMVLVQGNGCDLYAIADSTRDIVVSWHVMQHIPEKRIVMSLLTESHRILRAGGSALIHIPQYSGRNIRWYLYKVLTGLGLTLNPLGVFSAIPFFGIDKQSVLSHCEDIGFRSVRVEERSLDFTYYVMEK